MENSRHNILVVGCGQIGGRHLQSILSDEIACHLHVLDPSIVNHNSTKMRLGVSANRVTFHPGMETLPKRFKIAIIATNAVVRRKVMEVLLNEIIIELLVLEKILFQTVEDCLWMRDRLHRLAIPTWVNFPRRMQPVYQEVKNTIGNEPEINFYASGSRWGLATSSVHLLDLVLYLTGSTNLEIIKSVIKPYPSTRHANCFEATGWIDGQTSESHHFRIESWDNGNAPVQIVVSSPVIRWVVVENETNTVSMMTDSKGGWTFSEKIHPYYYQSQLTGAVIGSLISSGTCLLADYDMALVSHLPFLRAWNQLNAPGQDPDKTVCPIT